MPFRLCSAPSTLQRLMQNVLWGLQLEECLLYMGDVIVPEVSFQESLLRMEYNIFDRLLSAWLKLNTPSKCIFPPKLVLRFWGTARHVVSKEGISTGSDKAKAVQNQKQKRVNLKLLNVLEQVSKLKQRHPTNTLSMKLIISQGN